MLKFSENLGVTLGVTPNIKAREYRRKSLCVQKGGAFFKNSQEFLYSRAKPMLYIMYIIYIIYTIYII